jgi:hypothetical protein
MIYTTARLFLKMYSKILYIILDLYEYILTQGKLHYAKSVKISVN